MNELFGDDNDDDGEDVYIQCIYMYTCIHIYMMLECLNVCHAFAYLFPTVPSGAPQHFLAVL